MEDSSRNCKRSDGGIESSAGCSKKTKTVSSAESTRLSSPRPDSFTNSDELRRFSSPPDLKAVSPTTSLNSSPDRAVVGEFCSVARYSRASGHSCFSNVESSEVAVKEDDSSGIADLETTKSYETESSSTWIENKFRESSPSSSFTETKTMSTTTTTDSQISPPPSPPPSPRQVNEQEEQEGGDPTAEELDEFFAAAEKDDQRRFAEKYNFDVVKDVPLEGRYQWVRLKP